jgi:hypothetical protein
MNAAAKRINQTELTYRTLSIALMLAIGVTAQVIAQARPPTRGRSS